MTYEGFPMTQEGEAAMTQSAQIDALSERQQFFIGASLDHDTVFCGDERSDGGIHLFGGTANYSYNRMILNEAYEPNSVNSLFEDIVASDVPVLKTFGIQGGVHSDQHAEKDAEGNGLDHIDTTKTEGILGCGYLEKRQAISQLINDRVEEVLVEMRQLRPELFQSEEDEAMARSLIAAHGRIANRANIFTSGRKVGLKAIQKGARSTVLAGDHVSDTGEINLESDTTLDSKAAMNAGLPTYDQDEWALIDGFKRMASVYPYDFRHVDMSGTIDAIGTMWALGVKKIEVKRPSQPLVA